MDVHLTIQKFELHSNAPNTVVVPLPDLLTHILKAPVFDVSDCVRLYQLRRYRGGDLSHSWVGAKIAPLPAYEIFLQAEGVDGVDFGCLVLAGRKIEGTPCLRFFPVWRDPSDWTKIHAGDGEIRVFYDEKLTITSQRMARNSGARISPFLIREWSFLSFLSMPAAMDMDGSRVRV